MKNYYYSLNGSKIGPVSKEEILTANLSPDTLVWTEGMDDWKKIIEVDELKEQITEISSPPPLPTQLHPQNKINKKLIVIAASVLAILIGSILIISYERTKYEKIVTQVFVDSKYVLQLPVNDTELIKQLKIAAFLKVAYSNYLLGFYYNQIENPDKEIALKYFQEEIDHGDKAYGYFGKFGLLPSRPDIKNLIELVFPTFQRQAVQGYWVSARFVVQNLEPFGINSQKMNDDVIKIFQAGIDADEPLSLIIGGLTIYANYESKYWNPSKALELIKKGKSLIFANQTGSDYQKNIIGVADQGIEKITEIIQVMGQNSQNKGVGELRSESDSSTCNWCGRQYSGYGYVISTGKVTDGKMLNPFGGSWYNGGKYCSQKCANEALRSGKSE